MSPSFFIRQITSLREAPLLTNGYLLTALYPYPVLTSVSGVFILIQRFPWLVLKGRELLAVYIQKQKQRRYNILSTQYLFRKLRQDEGGCVILQLAICQIVPTCLELITASTGP